MVGDVNLLALVVGLVQAVVESLMEMVLPTLEAQLSCAGVEMHHFVPQIYLLSFVLPSVLSAQLQKNDVSEALFCTAHTVKGPKLLLKS